MKTYIFIRILFLSLLILYGFSFKINESSFRVNSFTSKSNQIQTDDGTFILNDTLKTPKKNIDYIAYMNYTEAKDFCVSTSQAQCNHSL